MSDLISRSALLAKMKQTSRYFAVKFDIEEAPAVDAVPVVHGRWEIKWNAEFVDPFGETDEIPSAVCPFCGHEEFYVAYDDDWAKPHNYCPNCGAKMDGDGKI